MDNKQKIIRELISIQTHCQIVLEKSRDLQHKLESESAPVKKKKKQVLSEFELARIREHRKKVMTGTYFKNKPTGRPPDKKNKDTK